MQDLTLDRVAMLNIKVTKAKEMLDESRKQTAEGRWLKELTLVKEGFAK